MELVILGGLVVGVIGLDYLNFQESTKCRVFHLQRGVLRWKEDVRRVLYGSTKSEALQAGSTEDDLMVPGID